MQGLFKFKSIIFSTDSISECAKECKELAHLKLTYPQDEQNLSLNINLKA